jgi:malate dehydrogenase (oxaloacetate-decarboxylating)
VGTDTEEYLNDPLYLGTNHPRIRGKEYDVFIDKFIKAVMKKWPKVLLQWEDFARHNARTILNRYRNTLCSFNDDIQGTAAVALAALLSATKASGTSVKDQRVVIFGAGTAGIGIAEMLLKTICLEGVSEEEALKNFYLVDKDGLIHYATPDVQDFQEKFALSKERLEPWKGKEGRAITLEEVVEAVKPHVLIGTSAQTGAFTKNIVRKMAAGVERPIIFPLSNPTSKSEAMPADLIEWSEGRAIVATGSPSSTVEYHGRAIPIAQCNNSYIFPGVGLGVVASGASRVFDEMFTAAATALSNCSPMLSNPYAPLFPPLEIIREVSKQIAMAVGLQAQHLGVAEKISPEELERRITQKMWLPSYPKLVYQPQKP